MLKDIKNVHFVGIGGAGMSAIAKILLEMGYRVSGSDIARSDSTSKLEHLGVKVFIGHDRQNIAGADAVVVSTAIPASNPEVQAAREQSTPVYHRADIVAALMERSKGVAIAGAHGKTTTTSMTALVLEHAGLQPTIIIGGELEAIGGNAKLGTGEYLVAEADESDGSFLKLSPKLAVVTNIENDHMDFYGTMENILSTFQAFLHKLPNDGLAILCFDNVYIRDMAKVLERPYVSYALDHPAEYMAQNITTKGLKTCFDVLHNGITLGQVEINVPGRHNISNALAALIVGMKLGLTLEEAKKGLAVFYGAKRRFQTKGRADGVWIVDDYAHHPTEINATLLAAKGTTPKRLICVFQPHRYTRTQLLKDEFGRAFTATDLLILTDVYSAGEAPIPGVSGETLKEEVERQTGQRVTYIPDQSKIARYLAEIAEPGDLIITMGAGNVYKIGEELIEKLVEK